MTELERAKKRIAELEEALEGCDSDSIVRIKVKVPPDDYETMKKELRTLKKENETYQRFFQTNQFNVIHQLARDVKKDLEWGLKNLVEEFIRVRGGREERIIMTDILEILKTTVCELETLLEIKEIEE